jgi:hypothetical protein
LPEFSPDISNVEDIDMGHPVEEGGSYDDYIGANEQED